MTEFTTDDRRRITRQALELGAGAAARHFGISAETLKEWRREFSGEPWFANLRAASLALSQIMGPLGAGAALGVNIGTIRGWAQEAGLIGEWESDRKAWAPPKSCMECGKSLKRAGFCGDKCRDEYIASGGAA